MSSDGSYWMQPDTRMNYYSALNNINSDYQPSYSTVPSVPHAPPGSIPSGYRRTPLADMSRNPYYSFDTNSNTEGSSGNSHANGTTAAASTIRSDADAGTTAETKPSKSKKRDKSRSKKESRRSSATENGGTSDSNGDAGSGSNNNNNNNNNNMYSANGSLSTSLEKDEFYRRLHEITSAGSKKAPEKSPLDRGNFLGDRRLLRGFDDGSDELVDAQFSFQDDARQTSSALAAAVPAVNEAPEGVQPAKRKKSSSKKKSAVVSDAVAENANEADNNNNNNNNNNAINSNKFAAPASTGVRLGDEYFFHSASSSPSLDLGSTLSAKQANRFHEYMQASPANHRQAQVKVLEYVEYWMCLPDTKSVIHQLIEGVMGELIVKEAWASVPREHSPQIAGAIASAAGTTTLPKVATPDRTKQPLVQRNSLQSPSRSLSNSALEPLPERPEAPAANVTETTAAAATGGEHETLVNVNNVKSSSGGNMNSGSFTPTPPPSIDGASASSQARRRPRQRLEPKEKGVSPSPTRLSPEASHDGKAPLPAMPLLDESALQQDTTSAFNEATPPATTTAAAAAAAAAAATNGRSASYTEIPQFYFPMGKPTLDEHVIAAPLRDAGENPHLQLFDGVSFATAAVFDGGEGIAASFMDNKVVGPRVIPLSTLRLASDTAAHAHIQREFSRLPPAPKPNQKVRMLSGRLRGAHVTPLAKQEANYRQQLVLCMQRITTQCFGVPRYFAYIILRLIQAELRTASGATSPSQRNSSLTSLLSSSTMGGVVVNAQHVKDFYDRYLRNKDSVRRTFDLLILSSGVANQELTQMRLSHCPTTSETSNVLRTTLQPEDFVSYMECLLMHHPGLAFLTETPDFQIKYLDTVIYRIYYTIDRLERGKIIFTEFAMSQLMDTFRQVDASEDINSVLRFFSYEHFYVLYCRFWELDEDRDMTLTKADFVHYAPEDVMNSLIMDRVFSGAGRKKRCPAADRIDYEDFVWFCLSEEDKTTATSIRYWFRVLDLDGDGVLSMYELQQFYEATKAKIAQYVLDGVISFEDVICQVADMLHVLPEDGIRLHDLMREPEATHVALNMLTNVVRFLQFEQRDPFVLHQERLLGGTEQTPWDRFARMEYDRMSLEAED